MIDISDTHLSCLVECPTYLKVSLAAPHSSGVEFSMFWNYLTLLQELRLVDILDIVFASIFIGIGIHVLRSSRIRAVSIGLLFFAGIFIAANQLAGR